MECSKKKYFSESEANNRLAEIKKVSTAAKVPKRSYYCIKCGGWHLTSMFGQEYYAIVVSPNQIRQKKRDERFIQQEAKYWDKRFNYADSKNKLKKFKIDE